LEQTAGRGADVQVEAAGAAWQTIPEMEASLAVNGVIVYLGRAGRAVPITLDTLVTGANRIVGARGHAGYGIFPNIIRLLAAGRLPVEAMITARLPFAETINAIQRSSARKDGKIIINVDQKP
jgi:threonine dehydrogenase-like Zn-dependent dehydrogenase